MLAMGLADALCSGYSPYMTKGLYIAYVTGSAGNSVILFYIGGGQIAGVDAGAMKYDGIYQIESDGALRGILSYIFPKSVPLITGEIKTEDTKIEMPFTLPHQFWDGQIIRISTPVGAINAKFEKLKELP